MLVIPKRRKLEGDEKTDFRIITVLKKGGNYNCRFVKSLPNGARVYQMMNAKDRPISSIWENVEGDRWVRRAKGATKEEAELITLYLQSLEAESQSGKEEKKEAKPKKTTKKKSEE